MVSNELSATRHFMESNTANVVLGYSELCKICTCLVIPVDVNKLQTNNNKLKTTKNNKKKKKKKKK